MWKKASSEEGFFIPNNQETCFYSSLALEISAVLAYTFVIIFLES